MDASFGQAVEIAGNFEAELDALSPVGAAAYPERTVHIPLAAFIYARRKIIDGTTRKAEQALLVLQNHNYRFSVALCFCLMMAQPSDLPVPVRIPAWKRIGLKLASESDSKKRKATDIDSQNHSIETNGAVHLDSSTNKRPKQNSTLPSHDSSTLTNSSSDATSSLRRKKSVTFTSETKKEDGDSAQKLYQVWSFSQQGGEEEFTPEEAAKFPPLKVHPANLEAHTTPAEPSPKKQRSKTKDKPKRGEAESTFEKVLVDEETEGTPSRPGYITYIERFHSARDSWKFNKAHQSSLLKHVFDIPPEHQEAFSSYIKGLKGQAVGRLIIAAKAVLKGEAEGEQVTKDEGDEDMEDPEERKRSQDRAMKRELQRTKIRLRESGDIEESKTAEFKDKLRKRKMAEAILRELGDADRSIAVQHNQITPPPNGVATGSRAFTAPFAGSRTVFADEEPEPKRRRTREKKQKTGVPDDDLESISSAESISSNSTSTESSASDDKERDRESGLDTGDKSGANLGPSIDKNSVVSSVSVSRHPSIMRISDNAESVEDSESNDDSESVGDSESSDDSESSEDSNASSGSESSDEGHDSAGGDER